MTSPGDERASSSPHGPVDASRDDAHPRPHPSSPGSEVVRLRRGPDHTDANDELARLVDALRRPGTVAAGAGAGVGVGAGADAGAGADSARGGPPLGRVGLAGVLADLDRSAEPCRVPGRARARGFRWDAADQQDPRWFPQGISTSADHDPAGLFQGRHVLLTSAYAKPVGGRSQGARITVVDLTDRSRPRYRHVLLVEAVLHPGPGDSRRLELRPVRVHAGGIVWHGPWLYVAATAAGLACFRTADIVHVPDGGSPDHLRVRHDDEARPSAATGIDAFGYRYVLPVAFRYESEPVPRVARFRFSFISLAHARGQGAALVAGEYARTGMTSRLALLRTDAASGLLDEDEHAVARGGMALAHGPRHMQGAVRTDDDGWFLTTSHGQHRGGSLWSGRPGGFRAWRSALPPGPEDLSYAPTTGSLWTLTEHPGARYVAEVDAGAVLRRRPLSAVSAVVAAVVRAVARAGPRLRPSRRGEHP